MLRRLPISRAVVGVSVSRGPRRAVMRTTVRWMLPTVGAIGAVLAGASQAWATPTVTVTATSPAGATTQSTLTWDLGPLGSPGLACQLDWDNGSGTPVLLGTAGACPFTNNPSDPNQVAYAVPGHAGKYALVVTGNGAGNTATSAFVHVAPVTPTSATPRRSRARTRWSCTRTAMRPRPCPPTSP